MSQLERIDVDPRQCGGRLCLRSLRIRVKDVLDLLAAGASREETLEDYPVAFSNMRRARAIIRSCESPQFEMPGATGRVRAIHREMPLDACGAQDRQSGHAVAAPSRSS